MGYSLDCTKKVLRELILLQSRNILYQCDGIKDLRSHPLASISVGKGKGIDIWRAWIVKIFQKANSVTLENIGQQVNSESIDHDRIFKERGPSNDFRAYATTGFERAWTIKLFQSIHHEGIWKSMDHQLISEDRPWRDPKECGPSNGFGTYAMKGFERT